MTAPGTETAQRILAEMGRLGLGDGYLAALQASRRAASDAARALLAGDVTTALDLAHAYELLDNAAEDAWHTRGDGPRTAVTTAGDAVPDGVTPAATRTCAHCGEPFEPTSPTQDYCTPSHRNLAYRARKRAASPPGGDAGDG